MPVRARAVLGRKDRDLRVCLPAWLARRIFEAAGVDDLLALFDSRHQLRVAATDHLRPRLLAATLLYRFR